MFHNLLVVSEKPTVRTLGSSPIEIGLEYWYVQRHMNLFRRASTVSCNYGIPFSEGLVGICQPFPSAPKVGIMGHNR